MSKNLIFLKILQKKPKTRVKMSFSDNGVYNRDSMENGQTMTKKADKISELTLIFLKFHTNKFIGMLIEFLFRSFDILKLFDTSRQGNFRPFQGKNGPKKCKISKKLKILKRPISKPTVYVFVSCDVISFYYSLFGVLVFFRDFQWILKIPRKHLYQNRRQNRMMQT